MCAIKIIEAGKNIPCPTYLLSDRLVKWTDNLQTEVSSQTNPICNMSKLTRYINVKVTIKVFSKYYFLKDRNSAPNIQSPFDNLLVAVYTKVYRNATGTFSMGVDILASGQTSTSNLLPTADVTVNIELSSVMSTEAPDVISNLFPIFEIKIFIFFNLNISGKFNQYQHKKLKFVYELE